MNHGVPSRSAEEVAIYRAAHQVLDTPLIFDDPLAPRVINSEAQLHDAGFLPAQPAFFSMLGVAIFIPMATLTGILALVASLPVPSGIVFDYGMLDASLSDSERAVRERAARASASRGEPFLTFINPQALTGQARQMGFTEIDDFGYAEANARLRPPCQRFAYPKRRATHCRVTAMMRDEQSWRAPGFALRVSVQR